MVRIVLLLLLQEIGQSGGIRLGGQRETEARGELDDARPSFGRFHNAAKSRHAGTAESLRHRFVRGHHEIFDQVVGAILLASRDVAHLAVSEDRLDFDSIEVQSAQPEPLLAQEAGGCVLQL